jgi:hypothetical protein
VTEGGVDEVGVFHLQCPQPVRARTKPEAERVGKYMIRALLSLEWQTFLEPEGKVGF